MINGEQKECSMQKKIHFPNGMGDTLLNRKKKGGGQDHRTNFSNKLLLVDNTQLKKLDCWVEEFFEKRLHNCTSCTFFFVLSPKSHNVLHEGIYYLILQRAYH